MKLKHTTTIDALFQAITCDLSAEDILSGKIQAEISTAITNERISRGLNQQQLAQLLNVSQGQVSKWESEDCNFTIRKLSEIAVALDMDLSVSLQRTASLIAGQTGSCKFYTFPSKSSWQAESSYFGSTSDYELEEM